MKAKVVTIGVYGFDEAGFFKAIVDAKVNLFCDIRRRRGMRGREYAFVNSKALQRKLAELGIAYRHCQELAPSQAIRNKQKAEDTQLGIAKRTREVLSKTYCDAYEEECLAHFDAAAFINNLGPNVEVLALFCVEKSPDACHRSLVARRLEQDAQLSVEHILP